MNTSKSDQELNDYTENKAFADSLKRMGNLLIPIISILLIPTFYGMFYLFGLLSLPTATQSRNTATLYIAQGVFLMVIPLTAMFIILAFLLKSARTFLKTFYNLPDSINVKEAVNLRVLGIIPMPPPLDKIIKFPAITAKDGKLDPSENWHTQIGGPAKLKIESGNAVYLERGNRFSRIVGQGNAFIELHERIKVVVNVGPQSREFDVSAWTKDGIKIDLKVKGEYFLGAVKQNNENILIPFDSTAIRNAVEQTLIGGKEGHEWLETAIGKTKGALSGYISSKYLEEVFMNDNRLFTKSTMDDLLKNINKNLLGSGVYLLHFQITDVGMQKEITEQRLETWESDYKSHKMITESEGKSHQIREREKARAEIQRNLIYTLANRLEHIDRVNFSGTLLLSIAALLDQSMSDPQVRAALAKEALETLEKTQEMIKFNFQTPGEQR